MKPVAEAWTIVIVGKWNTNIFSPEWTAKHLFEKSEDEPIKLEIQVAPEFNIRLFDESVVIYPTSDRLTIGVQNVNKETLELATAIAKKVLELLGHTPVRAVGINFKYRLDDPSEIIKDIIDVKDGSDFAAEGYSVNAVNIKRSFTKNDNIVNMSVVYSGEYILEFNFHKNIQSSKEAIEAIADGFSGHLATVKEVAEKIYGLELQDEVV